MLLKNFRGYVLPKYSLVLLNKAVLFWPGIYLCFIWIANYLEDQDSLTHLIVLSYMRFFTNVVIHTVKGFGIVNKAEIDDFLELSCFFDDLTDVGNLISGSSAFSKTNLNIWKFMVHVLLKPGLENFKHYFTRVWDECNCAAVWAFKESRALNNWCF